MKNKTKQLPQNPRYERETAKHKEINATQYKAGNTAALNTGYFTHTNSSLVCVRYYARTKPCHSSFLSEVKN